MAMTPYDTDATRALKWMHNNAPNLQSIINQKSDWYTQFQDQFWDQWESDVFNLQTASPFGLMVWCIILGVPASLFGLYPENLSWAFGPNRQNFVYSGSNPTLPNPNTTGGNFYGGGSSTLINLQEVRWALQLRYVALISNGRVAFINQMLNWIFNNGQPWNFAAKNYIYLADSTIAGQTISIANIFRNDWQGNIQMSTSPRMNQMTNSSADTNNSTWGLGSNMTRVGLVAAPDGTSNAVQYQVTTNGSAYVRILQNFTSGVTYTIQVWAKLISGTPTGGSLINVNNVFTLPVVGNVTTTWKRFTLTFTASGSAAGTSIPLYFTNDYGAGVSIAIYAPQTEAASYAGSYIPTTSSTVTVTDITLNTANGAVVFSTPPLLASVLTWTGVWGNQNQTTPQQFGTGDGTTTAFKIPVGAAIPGISTPNYMEYRIGAGFSISPNFINLVNSPQYGIAPTCAGTRYAFIQES